MTLPLPSLKVENYRNIEHLEIPELGLVNLFVGKNNVGKTSLLEALAVYVGKATPMIIDAILVSREEYDSDDESLQGRAEVYSSLVHSAQATLPSKIISIGSPASDDTIELQLVPYSITRKKSPDGAMNISEFVLENSDYINNPDAYLGLSLAHNGRKEILPLSRRPIGFGKVMKLQPLQFVKSNSDILNFLGNADVSDLWSMTVFSEKEDFIVQALSIIQEVKRITVLGERRRKDKVLVQTPTQNRVPLKSMGDGMNRIFTIALAMVNAENGFLLVDEFDNGLHYSVQENLWKVVFFLAEKLNIQVFATTHSLDCLYAFANTCNSDEYRGLGKAIRLERHDEALFSEVFSDEDLRKVVKHGVEIR